MPRKNKVYATAVGIRPMYNSRLIISIEYWAEKQLDADIGNKNIAPTPKETVVE
jgi:hypothetical protein